MPMGNFFDIHSKDPPTENYGNSESFTPSFQIISQFSMVQVFEVNTLTDGQIDGRTTELG